MRVTRIYQDCDLASGKLIPLTPDATNHLTKVLRLNPGDAIVIFNGRGGEYQAILNKQGKRDWYAQIGDFQKPDVESPIQIHLGQAILRGDKMDWVIQKTTELGVNTITPIFTQYCNVQLSKDRLQKRSQHWQTIAIHAAEQSGRTQIPQIKPAINIAEWLDQADDGIQTNNNDGNRRNQIMKLSLDPRADMRLSDVADRARQIRLLIGPEGGLIETEITHAKQHGYYSVSMGPRVLRTETAAITAIALSQMCWGDF